MPVLAGIAKDFKKRKLFKKNYHWRMSSCDSRNCQFNDSPQGKWSHVVLCASNPLSTSDDVAAALVKYFKIPVFAIKGESNKEYLLHINAVPNAKPEI